LIPWLCKICSRGAWSWCSHTGCTTFSVKH